MEELRSSDAIEKEILEDARKSAVEILKKGEDTVKSVKERWEKKTNDDLDQLTRFFNERETKTKEEILARLPLDMYRLRLEMNENLLKDSLTSLLENLSKDKLLVILEKEFTDRIKTCDADITGKKLNPVLYYTGMSEDDIKKFMEKIKTQPEINKILFNTGDWEFISTVNNEKQSNFPAIIFDTTELRISASVDAAAAAMLDDNRAELISALLGSGGIE